MLTQHFSLWLNFWRSGLRRQVLREGHLLSIQNVMSKRELFMALGDGYFRAFFFLGFDFDLFRLD